MERWQRNRTCFPEYVGLAMPLIVVKHNLYCDDDNYHLVSLDTSHLHPNFLHVEALCDYALYKFTLHYIYITLKRHAKLIMNDCDIRETICFTTHLQTVNSTL